jgi:hypothetical protein
MRRASIVQVRVATPGALLLAALCLFASRAPAACIGDCDGNGAVAINELVIGVNIGLGLAGVESCPAFDQDGDGTVDIGNVITGVGNGLEGCPVATAGIVFNGEANRLNAYDPADGFTKQTVIERRSSDPNGLDINGQICFQRGDDGNLYFIAGEDTGQNMGIRQGWGYFRLEGSAVGDFQATQLGKLAPTYQVSDDNAENYGCGFLRDGRLLTTDVGSQAAGPANGQLIVWFPPFGMSGNRYCKLDIAIGTPGQILVDDDDTVYLASARVTPGIFRYRGPFPTSDDAPGGCAQRDSTGAPLADSVTKELFLPADEHAATPNAIIKSNRGTFYVSSVINGVIAEYDANGRFIRRVLQPPPGETLGSQPYSTGSPLGLGIDSQGTIYYADIGIVVSAGGIGPGDSTGTVRRVRFRDGEPLPPDTLDASLDFPDGIGVLEE